MDLIATMVLGGVLLVAAVLCGWRGARPPDLGRGPRLVPWQLLMLFAGAGVVLMAVHAAALLGLSPAAK